MDDEQPAPTEGEEPTGAACVSSETVFLVSLGVGFCKLVGELVAVCLVDSMGRRRTIAWSNLLLSLLVFTIALKVSASHRAVWQAARLTSRP